MECMGCTPLTNAKRREEGRAPVASVSGSRRQLAIHSRGRLPVGREGRRKGVGLRDRVREEEKGERGPRD